MDDEKTEPSIRFMCVRVGEKSKCLGDGHAQFVYTWPGREPEAVCEGCARAAQNVARAMGFHLALTRVEQVRFPF